MADEDAGGTNGRATIREVYELVDRTRREILTMLQALAHDTDEAQERTNRRIGALEEKVTRLDETVSFHMELDGHPGTVTAIGSIKVAIAKYAGAAAVLGVVATLVGNFVVGKF